MRVEYKLRITINERVIHRVIIDPHYRQKHTDLDDSKILHLVKSLDGLIFPIEARRGDFEYFKVEPVYLESLPYRVILVMCIVDDFLGVINAFRVQWRSE